MKKKTKIVLVSICVLVAIIGIALYAFMSSEFYRKEKAPTAWDCSVTCAEESTPNNYVINYTDSKVISKTGVLTIQNARSRLSAIGSGLYSGSACPGNALWF